MDSGWLLVDYANAGHEQKIEIMTSLLRNLVDTSHGGPPVLGVWYPSSAAPWVEDLRYALNIDYYAHPDALLLLEYAFFSLAAVQPEIQAFLCNFAANRRAAQPHVWEAFNANLQHVFDLHMGGDIDARHMVSLLIVHLRDGTPLCSLPTSLLLAQQAPAAPQPTPAQDADVTRFGVAAVRASLPDNWLQMPEKERRKALRRLLGDPY